MRVHLQSITLTAVLVMMTQGCGKQAEPSSEPKGQTNTVSVPSTNAPLAAASTRPQLAKLQGKWARTDGDYLLEITSVGSDGKMEAAYYNPNPIKVSKALGISEAKDTKVFVELRDEGYPGCTYSLTYSPETDQLFGTYFQAAMQQSYEVVFSRLK